MRGNAKSNLRARTVKNACSTFVEFNANVSKENISFFSKKINKNSSYQQMI
jgi:hypothetical protein